MNFWISGLLYFYFGFLVPREEKDLPEIRQIVKGFSDFQKTNIFGFMYLFWIYSHISGTKRATRDPGFGGLFRFSKKNWIVVFLDFCICFGFASVKTTGLAACAPNGKRKSPQLEVGAQRAPRLLVLMIRIMMMMMILMVNIMTRILLFVGPSHVHPVLLLRHHTHHHS